MGLILPPFLSITPLKHSCVEVMEVSLGGGVRRCTLPEYLLLYKLQNWGFIDGQTSCFREKAKDPNNYETISAVMK